MRHALRSIVRPLRITLTSAVGALTTLALLFTAPLPAAAIPGLPNIQVHLGATTQKNPCANFVPPACTGLVTSGLLNPQGYYAYVLVTDADAAAGVAGVELGIQYDGTPGLGVEIYNWQSCALLEFPSGGWPASGGGNLLVWDTGTHCQRFEPGGPGTGAMAVCGYFYMAAYSRDFLRIVPRPVSGQAAIDLCTSSTTVIPSDRLGWAVFSTPGVESGSNPCLVSNLRDCFILGPETLIAGAAPQSYSLDPRFHATSATWTILSGPGQIVGSTTGSSVNVAGLSPGTFSLVAANNPGGPEGFPNCSIQITVDSPTPVERTTWSGIKAGFRAN